jgi:hypothetical protein
MKRLELSTFCMARNPHEAHSADQARHRQRENAALHDSSLGPTTMRYILSLKVAFNFVWVKHETGIDDPVVL